MGKPLSDEALNNMFDCITGERYTPENIRKNVIQWFREQVEFKGTDEEIITACKEFQAYSIRTGQWPSFKRRSESRMADANAPDWRKEFDKASPGKAGYVNVELNAAPTILAMLDDQRPGMTQPHTWPDGRKCLKLIFGVDQLVSPADHHILVQRADDGSAIVRKDLKLDISQKTIVDALQTAFKANGNSFRDAVIAISKTGSGGKDDTRWALMYLGKRILPRDQALAAAAASTPQQCQVMPAPAPAPYAQPAPTQYPAPAPAPQPYNPPAQPQWTPPTQPAPPAAPAHPDGPIKPRQYDKNGIEICSTCCTPRATPTAPSCARCGLHFPAV